MPTHFSTSGLRSKQSSGGVPASDSAVGNTRMALNANLNLLPHHEPTTGFSLSRRRVDAHASDDRAWASKNPQCAVRDKLGEPPCEPAAQHNRKARLSCERYFFSQLERRPKKYRHNTQIAAQPVWYSNPFLDQWASITPQDRDYKAHAHITRRGPASARARATHAKVLCSGERVLRAAQAARALRVSPSPQVERSRFCPLLWGRECPWSERRCIDSSARRPPSRSPLRSPRSQ